jgi:uroporphyrinogen decarboxylase
MNGRERVLAAVKRRPLDRVPVSAMGFQPGIAARVRERLSAPPETELADLLGLDTQAVAPAYVGPDFTYKPPDRRRSFFGSSHKTYAEGVIDRPLREASTVAEVEAFSWPTIDDYDFTELASHYQSSYPLALHGPGWTPTFAQLCELFGMETALMNLLTRPALIEAAVAHITALVCDLARGLHRATGGRLPIFKTADDLATQRGLMFHPDLWRRLFKPGLARQFQVARSLGMRIMIHACGDIHAILPDLVEMGLDILEPTQAHLPGMRAERLKREYGDHLTFFGAISTQDTLPYGTPAQVRAEVATRIAVLGQGGGYIVSPDHEVLDDVPPENVIALYEAAGSLAI